jgi:protoheme IX farnesyltransferase
MSLPLVPRIREGAEKADGCFICFRLDDSPSFSTFKKQAVSMLGSTEQGTIVVIQRQWIGRIALLAALLLAAALVLEHQWLFLSGGVATALTLLLASRTQAERVVLAGAAGATALAAIQAIAPQELTAGNGLALVGLLLLVGMTALLGGIIQSGNRAFRNLALVAVLLSFASAQVTFLAAGRLSPSVLDVEWLPLAERGAVMALGLAVFLLVRRALTRQHQPLVRHLSLASTLTYVLYLALVLSPLWAGQPARPRAVESAAVGAWALLVSLLVATIRLPNRAPAAQPTQPKAVPAWRITLNDYLTLMKYRVASLLLVTTLGGMVVAAQGWPGWSLVGWVMLGGILSVGGAGALNHYLDRDIDNHMGRTSLRPLPSGRMAPWKALVFGLVLSVLQFAVFWFKVNSLSAWLSTAGLVYYIVIYTIILKRSSPQNIVVGGAAGAFPPLVGWAAVTGNLSLGALYLFAIIFYWTPPHFWALALMRKSDYARARVPMLPVVQGEDETRRQILLYTVLMIALTVIIVPLRMMGFVYLGAALLLNAKFLWDAVKLYRQPSNQAALSLYKYSLLYLALLFAAMAVDRALLA